MFRGVFLRFNEWCYHFRGAAYVWTGLSVGLKLYIIQELEVSSITWCKKVNFDFLRKVTPFLKFSHISVRTFRIWVSPWLSCHAPSAMSEIWNKSI